MDVTDKIRPWMKECRLCPRNCGADRMAGQKGFCRYRDHGCKGCSPYVGGALHFRERGIRSCIFFRMFAGMQFLSEQKNIQGPEGKEDYTRTPGRTFFSIAGAGGK